jgi:hypothetical protein
MGAASSRRRWVAFNDAGNSSVRLFYSDAPGSWTEDLTGAIGDQGIGIIAADDTTALLAWAGTPGLRWGTLSGSRWVLGSEILGDGLSIQPTFCRRASGGFWMGFATERDYVLVRSLNNGVWGVPTKINANYRNPAPSLIHSKWFALSQDGGEYPAIAWDAYDGAAGVEAILVSVPTDTGWTVADQLADDQEGVLPTVARDKNGDVWVAYWRFATTGLFITHTYTTVTASIPLVSASGPQNLVKWQLSQPAPETWWAVLRQNASGDYVLATRMRAGGPTAMSWVDSLPPSGARYRIRRESTDKRYEWLSDPSDTPVPALATLATASAKPGHVDLSWYSSQATSAIVYRRTSDTDWTALGAASGSGDGLLAYSDRTVSAGRYAYRLGVDQQFTPETWVDVPSGFTLALDGFKPNPAAGAFQVAFTLSDDSPATLDVYSVNGRRVLMREVGSLGAGNQVIDLGSLMQPGVYWVRITQAGKTLTKKGVVTQ